MRTEADFISLWLHGLDLMITERLNQIHDEAIAKFRSLAKSTGQRTRSDRL